MLVPISDQTLCPNCGSSVPLSNAARIQSKLLDVSCVCHVCDCEWMYIEDSKPPTTADVEPQHSAHETPATGMQHDLTTDTEPQAELSTEPPRAELNSAYATPTTYVTH